MQWLQCPVPQHSRDLVDFGFGDVVLLFLLSYLQGQTCLLVVDAFYLLPNFIDLLSTEFLLFQLLLLEDFDLLLKLLVILQSWLQIWSILIFFLSLAFGLLLATLAFLVLSLQLMSELLMVGFQPLSCLDGFLIILFVNLDLVELVCRREVQRS